MADELQVIAQPDSVPIPSGVSTGYQQQNVIAEAMRNGFDGSAPISDTSTTIKIPIGGPVDVNGVLFKLASIATLTIPLADTDYYIYLEAGSTVDFLTPKLTTVSGTFSASKNARYTASNERILNWVIRRDASASYVYKMLDVQNVLVLSNQGLRTLNNVTFDDGTFSGKMTAAGTIESTTDAVKAYTGFRTDIGNVTAVIGDIKAEAGDLIATLGNVIATSGDINAKGANIGTDGINCTGGALFTNGGVVSATSVSTSVSVPASSYVTLSNGVYNLSGGNLQARFLNGGSYRTAFHAGWSYGNLRVYDVSASTNTLYYNKH